MFSLFKPVNVVAPNQCKKTKTKSSCNQNFLTPCTECETDMTCQVFITVCMPVRENSPHFIFDRPCVIRTGSDGLCL